MTLYTKTVSDELNTECAGNEKALRVVMISRQFYPWIGGTERQAQKLSRSLIAKGVDVKVVTGWWFRGVPQHEKIEGIPVYRNFTMWEMLGIRGLRKLGGYLYLVTLFAYLWRHRHEYDIIHVHSLSYPAFAAVLAGKWFKKKTIVKLANSGSYSDILRMQRNDLIPGMSRMLPVALRADSFVALTPIIVKELLATGVPAERIIQIPNGVEISALTPKANYCLNGTITLIFVGRLHPQKQLDLLIAACQQAAVARSDLTWRLMIVGDGPLRPTLEELVTSLDGAAEVIFCGKTDDVQPFLVQADIFILPSRGEGMSNALLEAMAYGLPCVVNRTGGSADVIHDEKNGLLVDCEKPALLTEALARLVDDNNLRERLGKAARQTVENDFAIERVADRYIAIYRELVKERVGEQL